MSIERVERDSGVVWRVRWRHAGHNHSKVLGRKRDAEAFDAEMRRRKRTGEIAAMDAGKETLAQFGDDWWRLYAEPNLAPRTLQSTRRCGTRTSCRASDRSGCVSSRRPPSTASAWTSSRAASAPARWRRR